MGQNSTRKAADNINQSNFNKDDRDRWMVIWTCVVAIFTVCLFFTSAISDYFIWRQNVDSASSKAATEEQLRAFLSLTSITSFPAVTLDGKGTVGFFLQIQNIGNTRTAWAHGWASVHYFPDKVPNNFDVSKPYDQVDLGADSVVAPNGTLPVGPVGVSNEEVEAAQAGHGVIVLWGHADYATIFNPTVALPLNFCVEFIPLSTARTQIVSGKPGDSSPAPRQPVGIAGQVQPLRSDCNYSK